jgi:hypothetical protein
VKKTVRNNALGAFLFAAALTALVFLSGRNTAWPGGGWRDPVSGVQLAIRAVDINSANNNHGRMLVVAGGSGVVREVPLYDWVGGDNVANVYRWDDGGLVVVDMNGVWIHISPGGEVAAVEWRWHEPLPSIGVGCFRYVGAGGYELQPDLAASIYLFKDPPRK